MSAEYSATQINSNKNERVCQLLQKTKVRFSHTKTKFKDTCNYNNKNTSEGNGSKLLKGQHGFSKCSLCNYSYLVYSSHLIIKYLKTLHCVHAALHHKIRKLNVNIYKQHISTLNTILLLYNSSFTIITFIVLNITVIVLHIFI